jgi:hypothetical protein
MTARCRRLRSHPPARLTLSLCFVWLLLGGCEFKSHVVPLGGEDTSPNPGRRGGALAAVPKTCTPLDDDNDPPETLECTGLYASIRGKRTAPGAVTFAPSSFLWSDGAEKHRWIYLPKGTQIDSSSPNQWNFPVGTRVWKEFKVGDKRVETRIFYKTRADRWRRATYIWNDDESQADFTYGEDLDLDNGPYHVPEQEECDDCHDGQKDRLLGFDAVSLGLPNAQGLTLKKLWEDGWLSDEPERLELEIGDDGTGRAAEALAILHINCGVSCHNDTTRRTANLSDQNFRLDVTKLDGRAPDETWNIFRTAVGQPAEGTQWGEAVRIVPGDPDASLAVQLMGSRRAGGGNSQMPPLASRLVDEEGLAKVKAWIERLPPTGE